MHATPQHRFCRLIKLVLSLISDRFVNVSCDLFAQTTAENEFSFMHN